MGAKIYYQKCFEEINTLYNSVLNLGTVDLECLLLSSRVCQHTTVSSEEKQNICITFVQRQPNVFDVGPTLYKCYTNVLCLLGCRCCIHSKQDAIPSNVMIFYRSSMDTYWKKNQQREPLSMSLGRYTFDQYLIS